MGYYHHKDFPDGLLNVIMPRSEFQPFPECGDPHWDKVDKKVKDRVIAKAEKYATEPVKHFTATEYMNYFRTYERDYDDVAGARREKLMILTAAECYENKGRFLDALIDNVWSICEESTWVYPAHNWQGLEGGWGNDSTRPLPDVDDPQIDLFAAETGACLAWVYSVMKRKFDEVTYLISERIEHELKKRIIDPFCYRRDFWWMSAHAHNWHIWCTTNCLATILLVESNEKKRALGAELALKWIESFITHFPEDGANAEGVTYWGVSGGTLYISLKLLKMASNGKINLFGDERVKKIAIFVSNMHINGRDFFNHGYCTRLNNQAIGTEIYNFGKEIQDETMINVGEQLYADYEDVASKTEIYNYGTYNPFTFMEYFSMIERPDASKSKGIYPAYVWYDSLRCMGARENPGSSKGFYLGTIGANCDDQSSHFDGGEFILYLDGKPVYIDLGNVRYNGKVIDARYRYEHFTIQTHNHNTITVNGCGQRYDIGGASPSESKDEGATVWAKYDLSNSYKPEAGIEKCVRTITLDRNAGTVTVSQQVECREVSDIEMHFITNAIPEIKDGHILIGGTDLAYDGKLFTAKTEEIDTENDPSLRDNWGEHTYRTTLTAHAKGIDSTFVISH